MSCRWLSRASWRMMRDELSLDPEIGYQITPDTKRNIFMQRSAFHTGVFQLAERFRMHFRVLHINELFIMCISVT